MGAYHSIAFRRRNLAPQIRAWQALRVALGGTAGLIAVPVCATHALVAPGFTSFTRSELPFGDEAVFDDGSGFDQSVIALEAASYAAMGATVMTLHLTHAPTASGIRFSHQHAMYETGRLLATPGVDLYQVEVFPALRRAIPSGATLEGDRPTCLCRLASDTEMDIEFPPSGLARPSVDFVEAVDYWNDLALSEAA